LSLGVFIFVSRRTRNCHAGSENLPCRIGPDLILDSASTGSFLFIGKAVPRDQRRRRSSFFSQVPPLFTDRDFPACVLWTRFFSLLTLDLYPSDASEGQMLNSTFPPPSLISVRTWIVPHPCAVVSQLCTTRPRITDFLFAISPVPVDRTPPICQVFRNSPRLLAAIHVFVAFRSQVMTFPAYEFPLALDCLFLWNVGASFFLAQNSVETYMVIRSCSSLSAARRFSPVTPKSPSSLCKVLEKAIPLCRGPRIHRWTFVFFPPYESEDSWLMSRGT